LPDFFDVTDHFLHQSLAKRFFSIRSMMTNMLQLSLRCCQNPSK
jgi:hypothetical protein